MNGDREGSLRVLDAAPPRRGLPWRAVLGRVGRLFARNGHDEAVATTLRFEVPPEAVWGGIMFYEEVPRRPLLFLRIFLPRPLRTAGEKTKVGSIIHCSYEGGELVKRITVAEPARRVEFEVLEQRLGVEDCVTMGRGSYEIRAVEGGSEVVLTTHYHGHLRPRWLWRPLEQHLAHQVHHHILDGMRAALAASPEWAALPAPPAAAQGID